MLIRKLELVLENCEVVTIDGKYVGDFYVGDIKREIRRMACNHIDKMDICHAFSIEIHTDANKKYAPFGDRKSETLVFDRLIKYDDITAITIHLYDQYDDNAKNDTSKDIIEHYYMHWDGDDDYNNASQHSKIAKTGWFYMTIGTEMDLETIFPADDVDNEQYADLHSSMLDIGDKYWAEHETLLKSHDKKDNSNNNATVDE
jgi:hypothetical protein